MKIMILFFNWIICFVCFKMGLYCIWNIRSIISTTFIRFICLLRYVTFMICMVQPNTFHMPNRSVKLTNRLIEKTCNNTTESKFKMHKVYTTFKITAFNKDANKNKRRAYVFTFHKLYHISSTLFRNFLSCCH